MGRNSAGVRDNGNSSGGGLRNINSSVKNVYEQGMAGANRDIDRVINDIKNNDHRAQAMAYLRESILPYAKTEKEAQSELKKYSDSVNAKPYQQMSEWRNQVTYLGNHVAAGQRKKEIQAILKKYSIKK